MCGDGLWAGVEECDDGNTESGDGCSSSCRLEAGFRCLSQCGGSDACNTVCGDGRRVGGTEECDDGNQEDGDGCSAACLVERGFTCEYGSVDSADFCTLGGMLA